MFTSLTTHYRLSIFHTLFKQKIVIRHWNELSCLASALVKPKTYGWGATTLGNKSHKNRIEPTNGILQGSRLTHCAIGTQQFCILDYILRLTAQSLDKEKTNVLSKIYF